MCKVIKRFLAAFGGSTRTVEPTVEGTDAATTQDVPVITKRVKRKVEKDPYSYMYLGNTSKSVGHGGIIIVTLRYAGKGYYDYGISLCNPKDHYSKEEGRKLSLARMELQEDFINSSNGRMLKVYGCVAPSRNLAKVDMEAAQFYAVLDMIENLNFLPKWVGPILLEKVDSASTNLWLHN